MGLGTRYEMEFVPGRPMVVECVRYERPTQWQMSGDSMGMTFDWGGQVVAIAAGTHLVLRMKLQPHGVMRLTAPLLRRRMQPDVERDIGVIKALLEAAVIPS